MNRTGHPALLIVDAVSSLGSIDFRQDEWQVDITVVGSQKGLMLPPGLGFNAVSDKALAASRNAKLIKNYWDWRPIIEQNRAGFFPYTPATNLLLALREALRMLEEEGLQHVFRRHDRHARATRAAVQAWGLDIVCEDPREYSSSMTAFFMPDGHDADRFRSIVLEHFDMSLGVGLSKLAGKVVRIGHLGSFNDLMLAGTLSGIEMGLRVAGVPHREGGVDGGAEQSRSRNRSRTADRIVTVPLPLSSHAKPIDSFPQAADLERALTREIRGEVRFDRGSRALYATDGSNYRQIPIGLVVPRDADDVVAAVAVCRRFGAPVLARGAGTSLAGQCCNVAVVFDFSKYMNRILEIDPVQRFARVEPGVVLDSLRNAAEAHRLTFGPDPSTHSRCTLGGMIGNNSCGTHSLLAGKTVDNVEELSILLYDGTD